MTDGAIIERQRKEIKQLEGEVRRMRTVLEFIQANYTKRGFIKRMCAQGLDDR